LEGIDAICLLPQIVEKINHTRALYETACVPPARTVMNTPPACFFLVSFLGHRCTLPCTAASLASLVDFLAVTHDDADLSERRPPFAVAAQAPVHEQLIVSVQS
jgi:hypothetical protein